MQGGSAIIKREFAAAGIGNQDIWGGKMAGMPPRAHLSPVMLQETLKALAQENRQKYLALAARNPKHLNA